MNFEQIDPNIIIPSLIAGYAAVRAAKAERNSRPVSNGWTYEVKRSFDSLQARLDNLHKDLRDLRERVIDHIEDHE